MHLPKRNADSTGKAIYTLAQIETEHNLLRRQKPLKMVKGVGTDTFDVQALYNRAKKKTISQTLCLKLVDVANKKGNFDMVKAYWNTYYCQNKVIGAGGRLYGNYCKNRFCNVCSGIKKAEQINKFYPIIKTWPKPYFVTITAKAVLKDDLNRRIEQFFAYFTKIVGKHRKRAQRNKGEKLMGIKSFECNFNPQNHTYNPHFHLIVPNLKIAKDIVFDWLDVWGKQEATYNAQSIKAIHDLEKCLIEVIKYSSKVFTDPTLNKKKGKTGSGIPHYIYVSAYNNIITAIRGRRIFERFGFNLAHNTKQRKFTPLTVYEELHFDPKQHDWVNPETEALLTQYQPHPELLEILRNNVDVDLE